MMKHDKVQIVKDAIPKVASAFANKAKGKKASPEVAKERNELCKQCVLFIDGSCSSDLVSNGTKIIDVKEAEKIGEIIKVNNITKQVIIDGEKYTRGCGCSMIGVFPKQNFYFDLDKFNKENGTGVCPLNKWKPEN